MLRPAWIIPCLGLIVTTAFAQDSTPAPVSSTDMELKSLRESLDLQNKEIDRLSLKVDLLLKKLGVKMAADEETTPPASPAPATDAETTAPKAEPAAPANSQGIHTVSKGETIVVIARKYGVSAGELMTVNHISDARHLQIGQNLVIPMSKSGSPTVAPTTPPTEQNPSTH
ncbi:MAG: LysM domain-containing protein [Chthoniobacteraceae bacterium]